MLANLVRFLYKQVRGAEMDIEVPTGVLVALSARTGVKLLRGVLWSWTYKQRAFPHFRGRGVQVLNPRYLSVGKNVVFGDDCFISPFSKAGVNLGPRVTVGAGARLLASGVVRDPGEGIRIGSHSAIGVDNLILGQGGVFVGDDVLLGPSVTIVSENHSFDGIVGPIRNAAGQRESVTIGNDVWIGAGCVIMAGVTIGDGCVVGGGSIVVKDLPARSIAVGNPAKVLRQRR
jgi:acetyltransferase-like isoleucine patch superfamily enzyme